ncbi:hypothetical protein PMIN01_06158 [Paraphaeosphaeria minitans]|uniref:Uncharacterized protein n=1 Tax=Paraphaeosphaeria minitans TaxID=565426 RepID=A0A9P6GJI8_9PLEO|nr:hypothetical protein PMIN01_06158 [Paraphaeosphaeria minitans]
MTYLQRWWWEVAGRKSGKGKLAPHEAKNGAREPVLRAIESSVCDGAWCESRGVASWSDLSGAAAMGRRQWVGHERTPKLAAPIGIETWQMQTSKLAASIGIETGQSNRHEPDAAPLSVASSTRQSCQTERRTVRCNRRHLCLGIPAFDIITVSHPQNTAFANKNNVH